MSVRSSICLVETDDTGLVIRLPDRRKQDMHRNALPLLYIDYMKIIKGV